MDILRDVLLAVDPAIIWAFRLSEHSWIGFFCGIFFLNLGCVVLGDITSVLARRLNRKVYGKYHDEMVHQHNLSVQALKSANKEAYKATNKQAHEAFGKYFFSQAGAFALSIWPVPFGLAWMDLRFGGVPLELPFSVPGLGKSVFYPFFFIPMYLAVRIAYGKLMRLFPFYQRILAWTTHGSGETMLSFVELLKPSSEGRAARPDQSRTPGQGTRQS